MQRGAEGFAAVERLQLGQQLRIPFDQVGDPPEDALTLGGVLPRQRRSSKAARAAAAARSTAAGSATCAIPQGRPVDGSRTSAGTVRPSSHRSPTR
ncbi:hypothetical protein ACFSTI_17370 [Rhizorhabdus histidinilytica]